MDCKLVAALYRLQKVQRKAKGIILTEFKTVAFRHQPKEISYSELIEINKVDAIRVEDEDLVVESGFSMIMKTGSYPLSRSLTTSACHTAPVTICGRYDLLTPKCFKYLHEASRFQADTAHQHETVSCRTVPLNAFRVKYRVLVAGGLAC